MIVLAGLIYMPRAVIGAVAVALIAGHNLLDGIQPGAGRCGPCCGGSSTRPGCRLCPAASRSCLGYPLDPLGSA